MKYLFLLAWFSIGVGGCIYLVMNDHPWFAVAVLLVTASIRISEGSPTKDAPDLLRVSPNSAFAHSDRDSTADNRPAKSATSR